jgi:hypothetical protein
VVRNFPEYEKSPHESESVNKNHSFARFSLALRSPQLQFGGGLPRPYRWGQLEEKMPSRKKAAPKKKAGKPAPKKPAQKAVARKPAAPIRKPASAPAAPVLARPIASSSGARPVQLATPVGAPSARPAAKPMSPGQVATAAQAEERRKAATRKLFARIRSLEAIVGADLRKRGSLLLSQAVDQWYAEATSATASDVSITNAARAVISQL